MSCKDTSGLEMFIGQLIALVTFFAFPAIKYLLLKCLSRKQGKPELWYLPAYGFRLVIRNIPNKKVLTDLKYKAKLRKSIPSNSGSSVKTFQENLLIENEDFFLFPQNDQILLCFKIEGEIDSDLEFVLTDKLGNKIKAFPISEIDSLISDYTVSVKNFFNFNIKIAKRVIIEKKSFTKYWKAIQKNNVENLFDCDKIIDVG